MIKRTWTLLTILGGWIAGYSFADARTKTLVLWDCETTRGIEALDLETKTVHGGQSAVRWHDHPERPSFEVPNLPSDWTGYNLIRFWLHSAKAVDARFMLIVGSENQATEGPDYWGYKVGLGFEGWKEFVFRVGQKGGSRSPRGWDQIDGISFTAAGWGNTPHPESDVILDDLVLEYAPPQPGPRLSDEQFFELLDFSREDLSEVRDAVKVGDLEGAKKAFYHHMKSRKRPVWRFDWKDRPKNVVPPQGGSEGWDYFATGFDVDWTGWKEFVFPLEEWNPVREPVGWQHINYLSFSATYGDRTPSPDTTLVFDDMALTAEKKAGLGEFESQEDFDAWGSLQPTDSIVRKGEKAGRWASLGLHTSLTRRDLPHDWRPFQALRFWAYSAKTTGDHITIVADSDTPDVTRAETILKHVHDGYDLGEDIDWKANKRFPEDPAFTQEWTYGLNRFRTWPVLGRAYWNTGDERYAQEWIEQMRDWVEDNPYPLYGTGNDTLTWRTIEAGIRMSGSWPDALYFFLGSPSLTPDDLVFFLKSWVDHAHHLMRITVDHPEHKGNWVTMECNGLAHIGVLFPECRESETCWKTASNRLNEELTRQVYPDGAQKELTTGYHQVALRNFLGPYKIAQRNEASLPAEYMDRLEKMYEYDLKAMTPEGSLPPLNDAGYTGVRGILEEGSELFNRKDFLWGATLGSEGKSPGYTSLAFPYAGQYVMRSGWKRNDRYLLFEAGPFGIGHQHEDKLSLFIYGLGRVLLTEAGTYSYDQSKYRRYVLSTWAHNTILVDGHGQQRRGLRGVLQAEAPLKNLWIHNETFDAANGLYESGYGPERSIRVIHERTVVFVRPDYWVVLDRLKGQGEHTYDVLWHLNNDQAKKDPDTLSAWGTDAEAANLLVTPVSPVSLSLEIVVGREDPVLGFAPASRKKPIPVLDYQHRANGHTILAWVLTPFEGDKPEIKAKMEDKGTDTAITVTHPKGEDVIRVSQTQGVSVNSR